MVIATGFFDGVHLGHQLVLEKLVQTAKARGEESCVITFWPHPRNVLQQEAYSLRLLTTLARKKELILSQGVDHVEVLDFTKEFSRLSAREYLEKVVMEKLGGKAIVLGYDNRVGNDSENPDHVASIAKDLGLEVVCLDSKEVSSGVVVSSTMIRKKVEEGMIEQANKMLGRKYELHGVVVSGNRIGRTIGFPTANMQLYEPLKLIPSNGVYFVRVETLGRNMWGMCNIGRRPTVGNGNTRTIETHILDFDEDIYGLDISIYFITKIREELKFENLDCLKAQIEKDKYICRELIND